MKKPFFKILISLGIVAGALVSATSTLATVTCPNGSARSSADSYAECSTPETTGDDSLMSRVKVILNVVIGLIGVVAVAMIILGGIQYTTSQGQPDKVAQARNILIYSVVGLVVAVLAFAIVNFALTSVFR